jgi:hypothetical protein
MNRKMVVSLFLTLSVSGCAGNYNSLVAQENYLLDTQKGMLCIEGKNECRSLSLIGPSYQEQVIAEGYQLPEKAYRWNAAELEALMLHPPNALYSVEQLSNTLYRLPPVFAVHSVWDVLAWEHYILYDREDKFGFSLRPVSRRF